MSLGPHTDRQYDEELSAVRGRLALMGEYVLAVLRSATQALLTHNVELARRTIARDEELDRFEREIDEQCMILLATRAPMGSDLRFVTTAMKIAVELERIGDLAVGICERVLASREEGPPLFDRLLPETAELALGMVRDALDAFLTSDGIKAQSVIARDVEVNQRFARIFDEMLALMAGDPSHIGRGVQVQSVAKRLERVADHASSIAQRVYDIT